MRWFTGLLVLLLAVATSRLQLPAAETETPGDYYPLKVGTMWHYRFEAAGKTGQLTNQIAKHEMIDGQLLARLEGVVGGKVIASEHLNTSPKGVFRHRFNGVDATPPLCLLQWPVKNGDSWETDTKAGGEKVRLVNRAGREEIEVPAGKYQAITVQSEGTAGDNKMRVAYWFASGVGIVKQVIVINGQEIKLELEKFEAGK